jgi:predicted outer membrane lipoprotein
MPILRLAYSTQFLIAVIAIFVLWSQVGGQSHLDLLPWWIKLGLGLAAAYGVVRATAASVSGDRAWNAQTLRWLGVTLAVLAACGYASYYAHLNLEDTDDEDQQADTTISRMHVLPAYSSVRLESARRLARSAPTSVTTMRSPS